MNHEQYEYYDQPWSLSGQHEDEAAADDGDIYQTKTLLKIMLPVTVIFIITITERDAV